MPASAGIASVPDFHPCLRPFLKTLTWRGPPKQRSVPFRVPEPIGLTQIRVPPSPPSVPSPGLDWGCSPARPGAISLPVTGLRGADGTQFVFAPAVERTGKISDRSCDGG